MANGDDLMIATLTHISREIEGMRAELRTVIKLDAEAKANAAAVERAFTEISEVSSNLGTLDRRVQSLEGQRPIGNLVRVAVFSTIGLALVMVFTLLFQGVLRSPPQTINIDQARTENPRK